MAAGLRRIGRTSTEVSRLAVGMAGFGWLYRDSSDEDAAGAVAEAVSRGVRYFDTAPQYGLGQSERRLGAALKSVSEPVTVSTKVGRLVRPAPGGTLPGREIPGADGLVLLSDWTRDGVLRSLDESRLRLDRDRIDIVYIHDPDDAEREVHEEVFPALSELRDAGVIGAIGVGMNGVEVPARFVRDLDLDVVLIAGRYTLLDRSARALLDECGRRGISYVAAGVFNSGVLAGGDARFDYRPASSAIVERVRRLKGIADAFHVPLTALALQFPLTHPAVVSVLMGVRSTDEVQENSRAFETVIPPAAWAAVDELSRDWESPSV